MKKLYCSLLFIFLFSVSKITAQVVINEYSCSNWSLNADNYGSHEDWIEIYNPTGIAVYIGGYYLSDRPSNPTKWRFPLTTTINAYSYITVWASGRDEVVGTNYHTNFRLTQTKSPAETIVLSDAAGSLVDQVPVLVTKMHQSRGRNPNGGANWSVFKTPSPGLQNVISSAKDRYAQTPTFSVNPGFFNASLTVSISTTEPNVTIFYTLDGTEPTDSSSLYIGPMNIDSTRVLKAIAISADPAILPSFTCFGTYFIDDYHTLPVVSIAARNMTALANGSGTLKPTGSIEYFDINRVRKTAGYGEFNRHGRDSWALDQRSIDYIMRDEFGYNYALKEQIFNLTDRDEFQRIIMRAAGDDNYPAAHHMSNEGSAHLRDAYVQNLAKTGGLDLDVRIGTKCIVYMNGQYWGVYDLRDNPDDHDFTEYYYGQGKYKLQYIETWGGTWAEYGGQQAIDDWNVFYNYIMANDMTNAGVWDNVTSQLDVKSLADYVIVNSIVVCSDWLNYNTGWWRGLDSTGQHKKWGYILWDNDAVFGFYVNYTGIPEKGPNAAPCNVESGQLSDPEGHIALLNKLRQNHSFNDFYISRYIDLTNTVFNCDNMLNTLDSITAVIDPEMTRHAARWSGTYTEWRTNVQQLRDFITQRCAIFPHLMDSCYNLTGPYPLYITADPIGTGTIQVNSLTLSNFPWSGNYYGGIPVLLTATPDTLNGFTFDRWEVQHNPVSPSLFVASPTMSMVAADTLVAHFQQHLVLTPEIENSGFEAVAFPSVFGKSTTIEFYLREAEDLQIMLYSSVGQPLVNIEGNNTPAGRNEFTLDLDNKGLASGIYLLNFKSEKFNKTLRLMYTAQ